MGRQIALVLFISIFNPYSLLADDVIDLGSLQIEGEVRRPPVQFFVAKEIPESVVQKSAEKSFKNLEEELLLPSEESLSRSPISKVKSEKGSRP